MFCSVSITKINSTMFGRLQLTRHSLSQTAAFAEIHVIETLVWRLVRRTNDRKVGGSLVRLLFDGVHFSKAVTQLLLIEWWDRGLEGISTRDATNTNHHHH